METNALCQVSPARKSITIVRYLSFFFFIIIPLILKLLFLCRIIFCPKSLFICSCECMDVCMHGGFRSACLFSYDVASFYHCISFSDKLTVCFSFLIHVFYFLLGHGLSSRQILIIVIVVAVVAVVLVTLLVVGIIYCCCCRRRNYDRI